jgi:hypothetical protein
MIKEDLEKWMSETGVKELNSVSRATKIVTLIAGLVGLIVLIGGFTIQVVQDQTKIAETVDRTVTKQSALLEALEVHSEDMDDRIRPLEEEHIRNDERRKIREEERND